MPWRPQLPAPDPELVKALNRLFDDKGNLTEEGWQARLQPGTYVAYFSEPWL